MSSGQPNTRGMATFTDKMMKRGLAAALVAGDGSAHRRARPTSAHAHGVLADAADARLTIVSPFLTPRDKAAPEHQARPSTHRTLGGLMEEEVITQMLPTRSMHTAAGSRLSERVSLLGKVALPARALAAATLLALLLATALSQGLLAHPPPLAPG